MLSEKPRGGLSETRKMTKSTMEKKRRARINNSLTELKSILSGMISNKGERFDKMEKADILEMTVKCVRQLQKQANTGDSVRSTSSPVDEDYRSGMHTCMSEVIKFISSSNFSEADPEVKTKLLNHLANKLNSGTTQKGNMDRNMPYMHKKTVIPQYDVSNMGNIDSDLSSSSDMSNDANNNLQVSDDCNTPLSVNLNQQKSSSPTPSMPSPMLTSYTPIQPVQDNVLQPTSVPTVPLTILVPANICSAALGTTCVIPFNLPTASPQLGQGNFLQTVSQTPQSNFTITSNSGFSFIQTPNLVQNAQLPTKANEIFEVNNQNRLYTFTPTVLSNFDRTKNQTYNSSETSKLPTVSTVELKISQNENDGSPIQNLNRVPKETVSRYQRLVRTNELGSPKASGVNRMVPVDATRNDRNCSYNINSVNCNAKDLYGSVSNENVQAEMRSDKRKVEQAYIGESDMSFNFKQGHLGAIDERTEHPVNRPPVNNPYHQNGCDSVTDMWRPWNKAI